MSWAIGAWSDAAWGGAGDAATTTAPTLAEILAADHQVYVVAITLPLLGGGSVTMYWSSRYYITRSTDTPASTQFDPIIVSLEDEASVNISPRASGDNRITGRVRVQDADGAIEALFDAADYTKKTIDIFVGRCAGEAWPSRQDDPFAWFKQIGKFTIDDVSSDGQIFELRYRDRSYELDIPVQDTRYAGTGTYEAPSMLKGEPKPLLGGYCHFVDMRLIDPVYLIYQFHDGNMPDIDYLSPIVWDNAIQLTVSLPPTVNLYTASIPAGWAYIDKARGLVRLGATPVGRVCFAGYGLYSMRQAYYEAAPAPHISHPDVMRAAVARRLPSFPIDVASFDALADDMVVNTGLGPYWEDIASIVFEPGMTLTEACNLLANGAGFSWWMTFVGKMRVGRLSKPIAEDIVAEFDANNILAMSREALPPTLWPPPFKVEMLAYRVQAWPQAGNIAAAASDAIKLRLQYARYNTLPVTYPEIVAKFSNAEIWSRYDSYGIDPETTEAQGYHLLDTHGGNPSEGTIFKRLFLHLRVPKTGLALEPYSTIRITYPRYGLDEGKLFVAWPAGRTMVDERDPTTVDIIAWGGF